MKANFKIPATLRGEIAIKDFTNYPSIALKIIGFDLFPSDSNTWMVKCLQVVRNIWFWNVVISIGVADFFILTYVASHYDDLLEVSGIASNSANSQLVIVRAVAIYHHKDLLMKLFHSLGEIFPATRSAQRKHNIRKYFRSFKAFVIGYTCIFLVLFVAITVKGIVEFILTGQAELPCKMWMPFDQNEFYPAVYFWMLIVAWTTGFGSLSTDLLIISLLTLTSIGFDNIKRDLESLKDVPEEKKAKLVGKFVVQHNQLIDISKNLEKIFSLSILLNFVQSSLMICFLAFQISTTDDTRVVLQFTAYLATILSQIFMICHFGQKLINSSSDVASGVYNCGWQDMKDVKLRRSVLLLLLRAQKPERLTARGFRVISIESCSGVRKSFV